MNLIQPSAIDTLKLSPKTCYSWTIPVTIPVNLPPLINPKGSVTSENRNMQRASSYSVPSLVALAKTSSHSITSVSFQVGVQWHQKRPWPRTEPTHCHEDCRKWISHNIPFQVFICSKLGHSGGRWEEQNFVLIRVLLKPLLKPQRPVKQVGHHATNHFFKQKKSASEERWQLAPASCGQPRTKSLNTRAQVTQVWISFVNKCSEQQFELIIQKGNRAVSLPSLTRAWKTLLPPIYSITWIRL